MKKARDLFIALLFIISCPILTLAISNGEEEKLIFIGCCLSFIFGIFIAVKYVRKINYNSVKVFISILIALYIEKIILAHRANIITFIRNSIIEKLNIIITDTGIFKIIMVAVIPALFIFVYYFIDKIVPKIKEEYMGLTKIEKNFLKVIIVGGFLIATVIAHYTTAFFLPYSKELEAIYNNDIIYTSDNGIIYGGDAYTNINHPENDIRQPLFGILALPFGIVGHLSAELLTFLPNNASYGVSMATIQFILIGASLIMLSRILKVEEKHKVIFFIFFLASAPYLIFSYCLEQYVIAAFYVILTIYVYSCRKEKINYTYIGATGSLLTSGILFPLITKTKKVTEWIKNIFYVFIGFLGVTCIGGQFPQFTDINKINVLLNNFSGKVEKIDQIKQFLVFVRSTLIFPLGEVFLNSSGFFAYRLLKPEHINIIGIVILVVIVTSVILNRKEKSTWICFSWVLFSVVILGVIGWGAYENGMILYSLYFSWAYLGLMYLFARKLIKNDIALTICMIAIISLMLYKNIPELSNIMKFAIQYYG